MPFKSLRSSELGYFEDFVRDPKTFDRFYLITFQSIMKIENVKTSRKFARGTRAPDALPYPECHPDLQAKRGSFAGYCSANVLNAIETVNILIKCMNIVINHRDHTQILLPPLNIGTDCE